MDAGGQGDADGVQEIIGRDQLALFFFAAALLQERVERHGEQAGGKAQEHERARGMRIGRRRPSDEGKRDAHADGAQRHQPQLDVIAG